MIFDEKSTELIKRTLHKNGWIDLPATGDSMFPLIKKEELCRFIPCNPHTLGKGDIVLFWTGDGRLVAHRFYYIKMVEGEPYFLFKGDTNLGFDEPISEGQIIGKLEFIQKNERIVKVAELQPYLWGKLILTFPILSRLLRTYLNRKSHVYY